MFICMNCNKEIPQGSLVCSNNCEESAGNPAPFFKAQVSAEQFLSLAIDETFPVHDIDHDNWRSIETVPFNTKVDVWAQSDGSWISTRGIADDGRRMTGALISLRPQILIREDGFHYDADANGVVFSHWKPYPPRPGRLPSTT